MVAVGDTDASSPTPATPGTGAQGRQRIVGRLCRLQEVHAPVVDIDQVDAPAPHRPGRMAGARLHDDKLDRLDVQAGQVDDGAVAVVEKLSVADDFDQDALAALEVVDAHDVVAAA